MVLYLIGAGLSYLSHFWARLGAPLPEGGSQWEHLLYSLQAWENTFKLGVMQRLAICYAGVAVLSLTLRHRLFPWVAGGLLAAYSVLLLVGNGYAYDASNWLGIVDRALLGVEHMPKIHHGLQPEGILSTLPAFAHTMLGFCVGKLLLKVKDNRRRICLFFFMGCRRYRSRLAAFFPPAALQEKLVAFVCACYLRTGFGLAGCTDVAHRCEARSPLGHLLPCIRGESVVYLCAGRLGSPVVCGVQAKCRR